MKGPFDVLAGIEVMVVFGHLRLRCFKMARFILSTFLLLLFMFKVEPQKWRICPIPFCCNRCLCYLIFNVFWNSNSSGV